MLINQHQSKFHETSLNRLIERSNNTMRNSLPRISLLRIPIWPKPNNKEHEIASAQRYALPLGMQGKPANTNALAYPINPSAAKRAGA
ncbi:hypothetical protein BRPE67_DCDS10260 (plasmid) [Caballeronia cordobensis]|nr:hypothetical protein BRPE67_DCDS10260 [Burkholderia sp. RPE67]